MWNFILWPGARPGGPKLPPSKPPPPPPKEEKIPMGPNVELLDSYNFSDTVADNVTFVQFSVPKCRPCEQVAPTWDKLAAMFKRRKDVKIVCVDCSKDGRLCRQQGVTKYPTFYVYKNGQQLAQYTGRFTYIDFLAFLRQFF